MSYEEASPEAEAGRIAEQKVTLLARSLGMGTFNANDGRNVAPLLARAAESDIIMPDLQLYIPRKGMWFAEVKLKEGPVFYQKSGTFRHGVDLPNWRHYVLIQKAYEVKVLLMLVQVKECRAEREPPMPRLLVQTISRLEKRLAEPFPSPATKQFPNGGAYWDVDAFEDRGLISNLQYGEIPARARNLRPWEGLAKDGSRPKERHRKLQTSLPWGAPEWLS